MTNASEFPSVLLRVLGKDAPTSIPYMNLIMLLNRLPVSNSSPSLGICFLVGMFIVSLYLLRLLLFTPSSSG